MLWISEAGQFFAQDFYLFVDEDSNPGDVSVFMKKVDLILAQAKTAGIAVSLRVEHRPDGIMKSRKVLHKVECIHRSIFSRTLPVANQGPRRSGCCCGSESTHAAYAILQSIRERCPMRRTLNARQTPATSP